MSTVACIKDTAKLSLFRAQGIGQKVVKPVVIEIDQEFPPCDDLGVSMKIHVERARDLANALCSSLPGGTVDALLRELLFRRASHFQVPFESFKG